MPKIGIIGNGMKKRIMFNGTELLEILDPGCGCEGCFFNDFENCSTPREKHGIGRCALARIIFVEAPQGAQEKR